MQPISNSSININIDNVLLTSEPKIREIKVSKFWRISRAIMALALTIFTLGIALCFPIGKRLWSEACTGVSKEIVHLQIPVSKPVVQPLTKTPAIIAFTFDRLVANSALFEKNHGPIPTRNNLAKTLGTTAERQAAIENFANNTQPILHSAISPLISNFLNYKQDYGTAVEKALYANMTETQFIDRLISKRPLMFMTDSDTYLLRNGQRGNGGFEIIGSDKECVPLSLNDYMSYDEMQIAALLGVAVPTYFINTGYFGNKGVVGDGGEHADQGVHFALVGARFEKPGRMEYAHMLITKEQNTAANGYGPISTTNEKTTYAKMWADFYKVPHLPLFEEVAQDKTRRFLRVGKDTYLDMLIYKARIRISVEALLIEANRQAKEKNTKAYVMAPGLGLGAWRVHDRQVRLSLEVYKEVIKNNNLDAIAVVDFSCFADANLIREDVAADPEINSRSGNLINLNCSARHPNQKLKGADEGNLLVVGYAWDGNAYPGNEYWVGMLNASGDPRAACSSMIPELQNPEINPNVCGANTRYINL